MPKIDLKPYSAEFADDSKEPQQSQGCDMPGCSDGGAYKAPRDRGLNEHYRFCLEHVQEYNKAWNYFSGLSHAEIEEYIIRSSLWDRTTKRFDNFANLEETLRRTSWQTYHFSEKEPEEEKQRNPHIDRNTPEYEAMAIMGLQPPLSLTNIKARYRELVKKHHPDINRDDPDAEELLKGINMAYTILKLSYEQFEQLPERNS